MQQPPPGPPESSMEPPPPMQPPPPAAPPSSSPIVGTSTGISRRAGSMIAYLLGWLTGIIMLFVGKDDPEIRFNAAQSIIFFGAASIVDYILGIISHGNLFFSLIEGVIGIYVFVCWIVLLVRTYNADGNRVEIPLLGSTIAPFAEQLAGAVA